MAEQRRLASLLAPLALLLSVHCSLTAGTGAREAKNILLLGGNGLLGGHATRRLHEAGHRLTIIHRGNAYWDWNTLLAGHFQQVLLCDRKQPLYQCDDYARLAESRPQFDMVIDFSGFSPEFLDNAMEDLAGLFRHYVFISTDSVYEVSSNKSHDGFSRESDAVRPSDPLDRLKLAMKDIYAERKMRCEERLQEYARRFKFSGVNLRLPDVIGPRDSTVRFWAYMVALELADQTKQVFQMPTFAKDWPISFAYVDDVARLMVKLAGEIPQKANSSATGSTTSGKVSTSFGLPGHIETVNFGNPETMTLKALMEKLMGIMELKTVKLQFAQDPSALMPRYLIPSVTRGPIDTTRSQELWKMVHTPWESALRASVRFYRQQLKKYAATEKPWEDQLIQRLYDSLSHLEGLRLFNGEMWRRFLKGGPVLPPLRPKKEL